MWVRTRALELAKNQGIKSFTASNWWMLAFRNRNRLSLRMPTNKKPLSVVEKFDKVVFFSDLNVDQTFPHQASIVYFHWCSARSHMGQICTFESVTLLHNPLTTVSIRYNVDQVPLSFASSRTAVWDAKGSKRVWVKSGGPSEEKRMATLQLCICPDTPQAVRPTIIFRGM